MNVVLPTRFNVVSLCSGIAGLDRGVKRAMPLARTICYVEREVSACEVLVARMQDGSLDDSPIWTDLKTFDGRPWRGVVDCVIAGIPCQGNSLAGKRGLEEDARNLWPDTRRILRDVGAEWFFLENVYGLLVPERGKRFAPIARILGELGEDGFDAEWIVVSAADVGASQQRERVFLLAHRTGRVRERNGRGLPAKKARGRRTRELDGNLPERPELDGSALELAIDESARSRGVSEPNGRHEAADIDGSVAGMVQSGSEGLSPVRETHKRRHGSSGLAEPSASVGGPASDGQRASGERKRWPQDVAPASVEPVADAARDGDTRRDGQSGSWRGVRGGNDEVGNATANGCGPRGTEPAGLSGQFSVTGRSRSVFGPFPPGPGFGLDRVIESVLADLESGKVGADDRFLAELGEWAKWQRVLESRPDLAPAISEDEAKAFECAFRGMADDVPRKLDLSRADKLRAVGNGVVELQAAVAFRILWERLEKPS